jgi:hypothetical protein
MLRETVAMQADEAGFGDCTAEARSKEFLIKKFSDLCELFASAVNSFLHRKPGTT